MKNRTKVINMNRKQVCERIFWQGIFYHVVLMIVVFGIPCTIYGLTLEISSTPAGAQVILNGRYQGETPIRIPYLSDPDKYSIEIRKTGYQTIEKKIRLNSSMSLHYELMPVTEEPQPASTPQPIRPTPTPTEKPPSEVQRQRNTTEKKYALIIGNSDYQDMPLQNPVHDAEDMNKILQDLGFTVLTKVNARQREMEDAINLFAQQILNGDVALFYFSGHGAQVKGENYLLPIAENIQSESDIRYKGVNAGYVLGKMEESGNRTNILILDACRNNPFKGIRSMSKGLTIMDAPGGTFIAYATAPNTVAFDGTERNGIYTKYLLKALQMQGIPIEQAFKHVLRGVEQETHGQQIPWIASSLRDDFYFNP